VCACRNLVGVIRELAVRSTENRADKLKVVTCLHRVSVIMKDV
jgi:hypothetical protein